MKLNNKTAIVTGAASGIGLAISEKFVKEGASVVMGDILNKKCKTEAKRLSDEGPGEALAVHCDVGKTDDVESMVKDAINEFSSIEILVNNAAIAKGGNVMDMSEEDWNDVLNTNLSSVFRCIKAVLPHMIKQKSGSIINMASTQAHRSWNNWTAYAAAKGGILAMTNQLAGQFAPLNIRFNAISPGTIETPMLSQRMEEEGEELLEKSVQMHAMERLGRPEEVASLILFLASDDSAFITGEDIKIDGGLCTLPRYDEF